MSGSGGGESGTAAGAPRGTCEEAEHLDDAGRADGGEVSERGQGSGSPADAELVEGRGRLAALPRVALLPTLEVCTGKPFAIIHGPSPYFQSTD